VEAYLDETDWQRLRRRVAERDRYTCRTCGTDCDRLAELLEVLELFGDVEVRGAWLRAAGFNAWPRSLWEANHVRPVVEGGRNVLENLELLCVPCHKAETTRQRRARSRSAAGEPAGPSLPFGVSRET